jgi:hypothetical protein
VAGIGHAPLSHGIGPVEPVAMVEANVDSFFVNFFEPHCGQAAVPRHCDDGTSFSNSASQL